MLLVYTLYHLIIHVQYTSILLAYESSQHDVNILQALCQDKYTHSKVNIIFNINYHLFSLFTTIYLHEKTLLVF